MFNNIDEVIEYATQHNLQSHICVCNSAVFDDTLAQGVYGFPTAEGTYTKSFMRAVASLYNIGPNDLIFIYRMNGPETEDNCKEIHGPFQICCNDNGKPMIYYEKDSTIPKIYVGKNLDTDCPMRFLFKRLTSKVYSIPKDDMKLIEKYENKKIWGYRHPAVMNIGAARKKSVSSFTAESTLEILELMRNPIAHEHPHNIPSKIALNNYSTNPNIKKLDESYLINSEFFSRSGEVKDEAYLYAYLLSAFCANKGTTISAQAINDFKTINSNIPFDDFLANSMLEVILSPHLQDEMDIVLQTRDESSMLFIEAKRGIIEEKAISQAQRYIDLLQSIFPKGKTAYANIIGSGIKPGCSVPIKYSNQIKLVTYNKNASNEVRFT